jgi:polysaccharide export outer membrane protein
VRRLNEGENGKMTAEVLNVSFEDMGTFLLKPMDFVTVKQKANWGKLEIVKITGEIAYPGDYVLMPGETLKDLITRAGGFTSEAFIEGSVFTRESVKLLEKQQAQKFADDIKRSLAASLITQEESKASEMTSMSEVVDKLANYEGKGRLVIDLKRALLGDAAANLEMQDKDKLHVPKKPYSVAVVGEIRQPGAHLFDGELTLEDYLSLSAGTTTRSDEENIYVVRASGTVVRPETSLTRFVKTAVHLQPGDTIVVPVDSGYKDSLPFWRDVTQVIYQGVVSIAAVSGL